MGEVEQVQPLPLEVSDPYCHGHGGCGAGLFLLEPTTYCVVHNERLLLLMK
jgi:hypothetical protein